MTVRLNHAACAAAASRQIAAARGGIAATCRRFGRAAGRSGARGAGVALAGLASALIAVEAAALGLGSATVSSGLGEPLRMSIPVTLQPDEEVGCVQVRPHGDDLPSVFNTRSQVLRSGTRTRIEIRSPLAVDEPAIGLVVSVGCASPVARDYVLFLDPPVVSTPDEAVPAPAPAVVPVPPRRPPRARAPAVDAVPPVASAAGASADAAIAPPRPPRRRAPVAATPATRSQTSSAGPSTPASGGRGRSTGGDRLSVVPTEPPVIGRTSPSPQPGFFPPAVVGGGAIGPAAAGAAAASPAAAPAPATDASTPPAPVAAAPVAADAPASTAPASAAPADNAPAVTAPPSSDAGNAAQEEALRKQQVALQLQIKNLADQIAALRVQATSLAVRNQALEDTAFSSKLVWLLIVLAALAIVAAVTMAWRYRQLRRSLDSAWWAGQTARDDEEPVEAAPAATAKPTAAESAMRPSIPPTTMPFAAPEPRPPASAPASSPLISNVDRIKPAVRAPGSSYPAAMDSDFTVSDIEAAMATVRTVSPPRKEKPNISFEDSDFQGLGGPTITSPFSEAPPAPAVVEDEMAHFVDLDIAPVQSPTAARAQSTTPSPTPVPAKPAPNPFDALIEFAPGPSAASQPVAGSTSVPPATADRNGTPADLAFRLDIPEPFDPLATDSLKKTVVDRRETDAVEPDGAVGSSSLDFELPSQTQIFAMTTLDRTFAADPVRHGATALHDLFAANGDGPDTILDLHDPASAPLTGTEVDRLTAPAMDPTITVAGLSGRSRMARFGDMVTHLDELAVADPLAAIARLREYVLREERIPTLLWLRLFELYKVVAKRPVYEGLAEHFARRYHRPMVGWTEELADRTPQRPLSALVDIDREIEARWGTAEGAAYVENLLCDRTQVDAIVFNAVLHKDLLDAAKIFPEPSDFDHGDGSPPPPSEPRR